MESLQKNTFETVQSLALPLIKSGEIELITEAYSFADAHKLCSKTDERGELFLQELIDTAVIAITQLNLTAKAVISIFLYKFVPEYMSLSEVEKRFGYKVVRIIEGIIRVQKIDTSKALFHSENFIRLLLTQADDVRVILIMLACKLNEINYVATDKKELFYQELSSLYAPIAHRLGLYKVKTEMEEQAMKFLHNDMYKTIANKLSESKSSREAFIHQFIDSLHDNLKQLNIPYEIKGRPKSIHSIWNKIKAGNVEFERIYDLFAIRIIIDSKPENEKADCWNVYSVVSDIFKPNPKRLRDWISSPKPSGYESLHTTVLGQGGKWVEVQIRTNRMDEIAEKGFAAHWKYKGGKDSGDDTSWLSRIREALETSDDDTLESANSARLELYRNEIFVFTPNGDLRKMAQGSSMLDFAYEIHSSLGDTCVGGKVNGKIVPIRYILQNGDKIEIQTSKSQSPKRDWLNFVISSKAKHKIKRFLVEQENKEADAGKEILMRKLNQIKVKFDDESVHKLVNHLKVKNAIELYVKIAKNEIDTLSIKSLFEEPEKEAENKPVKIDLDELQGKIERKFNTADDTNYLIIDETIDKIEYKLAKCCNPIKGDDIFGFVSAGGGVKIHRLNCPNAVQMLDKYAYRIIKAKWTNAGGNAKFIVGIRVTGADEVGIISTITQKISQDHKIQLRGINIESKDGMFEGKLSIFINDNEDLDAFLKKIKAIKGVHSATRYDFR